MQPAFFKVLALSIAAVILALTPIASIAHWVEGGSEIIYSRPDYSVIYKPNIFNAITGSNDTRVKIEVRDEAGRPLGFFALLSGVSPGGAVDVGSVKGKGYAIKSIGRYVVEVKRLLREANADPKISGLGMLILISTIIKENGEYYAAADAVTVPIIPGKAVGKDVEVTVKFKPIMKYKVENVENSSSDRQVQSTTGPPKLIQDYCIYGDYCYEWRLIETLYDSRGYNYIPVAITKLGYLGGRTYEIRHIFTILLRKADVKYVSFDMSMGWRVGNEITLYAPGSGFVRQIREEFSQEIIYHISCTVYSTSSQNQSHCVRPQDGITYFDRFTDDVLFSTGFWGRIWLVRYEYALWRYACGPVGCYSYKARVINDNVLALWMQPFFDSENRIWPKWELDDDPRDYIGVTEKVLKILEPNITYKFIDYNKGALSIPILKIYEKSQPSSYFGAAIALGALIVARAGLSGPLAAIVGALSIGVEAGMYTNTLYASMGYFEVYLLKGYSNYVIYGYYGEFINKYGIKKEGNIDKIVPLMIFWPS